MAVLRVPLHVTYIDGREADVVAMPLELMEFERRYSVAMTAVVDPSMGRLEYLLFLGWAASKRSGDVGDFDEWAATVAGIEPGSEEPDGSDPLDPSPSTGS